jgi:ribokinase
MSICVVGSANLDFVFRADRFPAAGETVLGGDFASFPGGKGANQAVAIGKLGGEVHFVGCVGDDRFGDVLVDSLRAAGVDTALLRRVEGVASGCAGIVLDKTGQNQIIVAPGANLHVSAEQVQGALAAFPDAAFLAQLEIPLDAASEIGHSQRAYLNPAPAAPLPDSLLAQLFAITPNETETEVLTGIRPDDLDSCRVAAKVLLDKGSKNVVITLGENGCFWTSGLQELLVPSPKVKAVDTVAAGDCFTGALVYFLSEGRDWENALHLAAHAAALSVTREGAQASMPTRAELQSFAGALW